MIADWFAHIRRLLTEKPPVALLIVTVIVVSSASLLSRLLANDSLMLGPPRQVVSINSKMG
ncbi:MAG: hypothetical protein KDE54_37035, partial [Caldilineaceae bacterium]|nr:hypothetical protein [Caldilineaceae bacterium]